MMLLEMDKWNVRKWFFPVSRHDFRDAVDGLKHDIETLTDNKFVLRVAFYQAASDQPEKLIGEVTNTSKISGMLWRQSSRVEATLTPYAPAVPGAYADEEGPPSYKTATVSVSRDMPRQISFSVSPSERAGELCRRNLDTHHRLWSRGLGHH